MRGIHTWFSRLTIIILVFGFASCGVAQDVPKKAKQAFREAYNLYTYQEYKEADEAFKKLIRKYPEYIDPYDALAKSYQEQGKDNEAIEAYRTVLEMQPGHYFATLELANVYFKIENLDSAAHFYSNFLNEHAGNDENTETAKRGLKNIAFIRESKANQVDINPINLGSGINTSLEEYSPAFTIDEQTIFITHRDPKYQNEDIYYSTIKDGEWTKARPIGPPINTADNEGAFSVSADGRYIFFTACSRPGGIGQCDIWITVNKDGKWTEPMNIGTPVNSRSWESQPSLASNGRDLYFTSDRSGGFGGTDLYVTTFSDSGWSMPQNLGPTINTSKDEQFPFIHPDGSTLYFSSAGHAGMGKADLFLTHKLPNKQWEEPTNLGSPINTAGDDWNLIVSRDGETAYYSTNKHADGFGGMDIFSFKLPKNLQAKKVNYARGTIRDADTKKKIGAAVVLTPLSGENPTTTFAPSSTGQFVVALNPETRYALTIEKETYLFHSEYFDMPQSSLEKPFELEIFLRKIKEGEAVVLKNVFFDTDQYELKSESFVELNKLVELLNNNETINIEIRGHTDNIGGKEHNIQLSNNRAKAVYDFLVSKGIEEKRLQYTGLGDSLPISDNDTEEGRALNRRTEFKIVN